MAWTNPKTWSSEPLTSIDLNRYVRDNQNHLKDRIDSSANKSVSGSVELKTTATEFVDADSVKLALSLTTHGGDVLLGFSGAVLCAVGIGKVYFNISLDGVDHIANNGITALEADYRDGANRMKPVSFVMLLPGLSVGQHSFALRWKVSSGNTATLKVTDLHPQFWAKEI